MLHKLHLSVSAAVFGIYVCSLLSHVLFLFYYRPVYGTCVGPATGINYKRSRVCNRRGRHGENALCPARRVTRHLNNATRADSGRVYRNRSRYKRSRSGCPARRVMGYYPPRQVVIVNKTDGLVRLQPYVCAVRQCKAVRCRAGGAFVLKNNVVQLRTRPAVVVEIRNPVILDNRTTHSAGYVDVRRGGGNAEVGVRAKGQVVLHDRPGDTDGDRTRKVLFFLFSPAKQHVTWFR